ncbi:MAG: hypothetical protein ISS70_08535 [Phycisphaerae bacterium]|nr:hypothetical protein [Phycisphaerae bacterium]
MTAGLQPARVRRSRFTRKNDQTDHLKYFPKGGRAGDEPGAGAGISRWRIRLPVVRHRNSTSNASYRRDNLPDDPKQFSIGDLTVKEP